MSKVFEALRRLELQSENLLVDISAEAKGILQQTATDYAAHHVAAKVELPAEPIVPDTEERSPEPSFEPRVMSLRVSVKSPLVPFLPAQKSHVKAAEQYRTIRTKIVQHSLSPRMIAVSSVGSGDGKTVTSVNLAATFALKDEAKILLVDGDLRRGSIGSLLGMPETPGLADILSGTAVLDAAVVRTQQLPGLHVLPAGSRVNNPAELLDSFRWQELAAEMRNKFDYVIVDTPPIGVITDCDLIQAAGDGIVMVARLDCTNRARCLDALAVIPPERLFGVILNCAEEWFLTPDHSAYIYETLRR